jgi:hypothetical protein
MVEGDLVACNGIAAMPAPVLPPNQTVPDATDAAVKSRRWPPSTCCTLCSSPDASQERVDQKHDGPPVIPEQAQAEVVVTVLRMMHDSTCAGAVMWRLVMPC